MTSPTPFLPSRLGAALMRDVKNLLNQGEGATTAFTAWSKKVFAGGVVRLAVLQQKACSGCGGQNSMYWPLRTVEPATEIERAAIAKRWRIDFSV